ASPVYISSPDAVVLAVQTRDIAPDLWRDYADLSFDDRSAAIQRVINNFRGWVRAFRDHSKAHLIIHALEESPIPTQGVLGSQLEETQRSAIQQINRELRRLACENSGVYVLDYDALVARHG